MDIRMIDYVDKYYGRAKAVQIGDVILYFSYETLIGVQIGTEKTYIQYMNYSNTTRRHKSRIPLDNREYVSPSAIVQYALEALHRETAKEVGYDNVK